MQESSVLQTLIMFIALEAAANPSGPKLSASVDLEGPKVAKLSEKAQANAWNT
jgi:hypothetical protein